MSSQKMPGQTGDDPFNGTRPGEEVMVHQDMPANKRGKKHHIASTHVGAYYGVDTGNGVAFIPSHMCSKDGEMDGK